MTEEAPQSTSPAKSRTAATAARPDAVDRRLRQLVWLYAALLVLEGALRKWVLPSLSDPLLLARDPVVLLAYAIALVNGRFPFNRYVVTGAALMLLYGVLTTFFGHGDLFVTLFGIRANFLHFPFAFIIGRVFYADDVVRLGRWWLWGALPMTAIIVLQFYSPQSAWINLSVGGIEGGGFSGALGRYRPPGTFSFIVGVTLYYTLATGFLVAGLTQHKRYSKTLLAMAGAAILLAIPVSISRSLILTAGLTFAVGVFTSAFRGGAVLRYLRIGAIILVAGFIVMQLPAFQEAKEAFVARWERSTGEERGGVEEAIIGRILYMFYGPFTESREVPVFGYGIGAGTQVGAKLLTGERGFDLGESEWFRIIGESGRILGTLFILWRVALCFKLFTHSALALVNGNGLGLIFLSTSAFNLLTGQLGQTTVNGFTVLGVGLTIASMRLRRKSPQSTHDESGHKGKT